MKVSIIRLSDNTLFYNDVKRFYVNNQGTAYIYTENHMHILRKKDYKHIDVRSDSE